MCLTQGLVHRYLPCSSIFLLGGGRLRDGLKKPALENTPSYHAGYRATVSQIQGFFRFSLGAESIERMPSSCMACTCVDPRLLAFRVALSG